MDSMSIDEAIEVIDTEMKCVERQSFPGQCNRDCFNCDLVLMDHTILCAYDMAKYALLYMKENTSHE